MVFAGNNKYHPAYFEEEKGGEDLVTTYIHRIIAVTITVILILILITLPSPKTTTTIKTFVSCITVVIISKAKYQIQYTY